ncbi:MAG: cytochrome c peroxidase [Nitrosomonas sp.]
MPVPADNAITKLRVELGKLLFYDERLSGDGSTSCGSCHVLSSAFTDGRKTSPGFNGNFGKRNAPTLANLAWSPRLMMEGGVHSLEMQVLAPAIDTNEMNISITRRAEELNKDERLNKLSRASYNRDLDPYVIVRAIASFERTLISGDSRYDHFQYFNEPGALNDEETRGMELFFSDSLSCSSCHSGVFFTDNGYYNIGLYSEYEDKGLRRVTYNENDVGKFKVPTLRNIELTAPYMHDGSLNTLEEVIDFFNEGGLGHVNQDRRIRPLHLNESQKKDLIAFLKTLTDWNFVQNAAFLPNH